MKEKKLGTLKGNEDKMRICKECSENFVSELYNWKEDI